MEDAGETLVSSDGENATPCKRQRLLGGPDQTAGESAQPAASLTVTTRISNNYKHGPRPIRTRRQWSSGVLTGGRATTLGPNGPPGQSPAAGAEGVAALAAATPVVAPTVGAATPMQPMPPRSIVAAAAARLERAVEAAQAQDLSIVLSSIVKLMSENTLKSTRMKELATSNAELRRAVIVLTRENEQLIMQMSTKQETMEGMREHAKEVKNLVHESEVNVTRNRN